MSGFFMRLTQEGVICDFAETLDWLFDDMKFSSERNWNRGYTASYTKRIKLLPYLANEDIIKHDKYDGKDFPNQHAKSRKRKVPCIMMKKSESFARDLIRYIRNGIAHNQIETFKNGDEWYFEIIDYSDKTKSPEKQTAYLCIPLFYLKDFHKAYQEINNSIMKTKNKDRKATKKHKKEE